MKRYHFVSGLPRAGSTLLCALLKQNPRFSAAMTSPVLSLTNSVMRRMSGASEFGLFFDDGRRRRMIQMLFEGYYGDSACDVIFDTNRTWTAKAALLQDTFPQSKIICCVREIYWVIDSLERMLRKNPQQLARVFNYQPGSSIYGRVELLMNSETGLIGLPWSALREAWFSESAPQLLIVQYDTFVREPYATVRKLYAELGESWFEHDFENVEYDRSDYDTSLGMPGLHKVDGRVEPRGRSPSIPPDLIEKYRQLSFWTNPKLNPQGARVI